MKMNIIDLTLKGQLSKINYGDNLTWTKLNYKELKEDFFKTLKYYEENKKYLSKGEREYLNQLEEIKNIVYGNMKEGE